MTRSGRSSGTRPEDTPTGPGAVVRFASRAYHRIRWTEPRDGPLKSQQMNAFATHQMLRIADTNETTARREEAPGRTPAAPGTRT